MGISAEREEKLRAQIESDYSWQQQPHPAYELQNLGGNIRRLEKRLAEVADRVERTAKAEQAGILMARIMCGLRFPTSPRATC